MIELHAQEGEDVTRVEEGAVWSGPLQVLSLDGGGFKGIFSAAVLAELEADLRVSLVEHFDLIAGTSTGGLIALALGAGLDPADIVEFYSSWGPRIFGRGGKLRHLLRSKHAPAALHGALEEILGSRRLWESRTRLVIPSYSLDARDVYLFKTPHHPRLRRDYRETMVDVAMATTAAPTYLPAFRVGNSRLVDGGVWATNPALVAVAEATSMLGASTRQVRMLSLGTTDEITSADARLDRGGALQWARYGGVPLVLRAQAQASNHATEHILGRGRVTRIDTSVPAGLFALDRVDVGAIRALAEDVSRRRSEEVKEFLEHEAQPFEPLLTTG